MATAANDKSAADKPADANVSGKNAAGEDVDVTGRPVVDDEGRSRFGQPVLNDDGVEVDSTGAPVVDAGVLGLAKHIEAWRDSYGEDAVDEAIKLADDRRDKRDKAAKDAAAADRKAAGTSSSSAPTGRSSTAEGKAKA